MIFFNKLIRRLFNVHSVIRIMYHKLTVIFTFQRTYIVSTFPATVRSSMRKGHVSFCHHLASFVCYLFTFESPLKLLVQMNQNLIESIYGRFSIKIAHVAKCRSADCCFSELHVAL
jgi:hypothetical protein